VGADIDHRHHEAKEDLLAWGKWIIDEIGAAGFRFDAIKVRTAINSSYISD
jgi:alpha-amylase